MSTDHREEGLLGYLDAYTYLTYEEANQKFIEMRKYWCTYIPTYIDCRGKEQLAYIDLHRNVTFEVTRDRL